MLSVSGTVFSDANGLTDNTVNGTGTNSGGALYMNLVNSLNQVVASKAVAANGTYQFTDADGLAINTSYKLILSNGIKTVGSTFAAATYPAGVTSTGENIGTGAGNDGTIDGILAINTNAGNLANADFGITAAMAINAGGNAAICSSAGSYTLGGAAASNFTSLLWTSNGTGSFSDATLLNPDYIPSAADIATGEVQLTLTGTGVGTIPTLSSQMTLTIWKAATAFAGNDASLCNGATYQILDAAAANYASVAWSINAPETGVAHKRKYPDTNLYPGCRFCRNRNPDIKRNTAGWRQLSGGNRSDDNHNDQCADCQCRRR